MEFHQQDIVQQALKMLEERARYEAVTLGSPGAVKDFLRLRIGALEREEFWCAWVDCQNRLIEFEQMAIGTLTQTSVYPRELVKRGLALNAGAVILAHNHPSGIPSPSRADEMITEAIKRALALVDIKVLDHIIVAGVECVSFAERGLV